MKNAARKHGGRTLTGQIVAEHRDSSTLRNRTWEEVHETISSVKILLCALCVVLSAQQSAHAPDFKALMQQEFAAWGALDPAKTAHFYAKDALVYDIAPMEDVGWRQIDENVRKAFADVQSARWTLNDDVRTHASGNTAWGTATWHGDLSKKDGSSQALDGRYTVWEKRGNNWLVVHEHMSLPAGTAGAK